MAASEQEVATITKPKEAKHEETKEREQAPKKASLSEETKWNPDYLTKDLNDKLGFIVDEDSIPEICTFDVDYKQHDSHKMNYITNNVIHLKKYMMKHKQYEPETLWFGTDKNREIYTSIYINNISNIDSNSETFRARFDITFKWIPTRDEYKVLFYCHHNEKIAADIQELKENICVRPNIIFPSSFCINNESWDIYGHNLEYNITSSLKFGGLKPKNSAFKSKDVRFITSTAHFDVTFIEEFELQQYPFDIQDFTMFLCTTHKSMQFVPDLSRESFAIMATECAAVGDYQITNGIIEFGEDTFTPSGKSEQLYKGVIIRLKAKRRWLPIVLNNAFIMFCLCVLSLTAFTIPIEEATDRMNLILTLILTAVASQLKSDISSSLTLLDNYMFVSYLFLSFVMIEAAFCRYMDDDVDTAFFYLYLSAMILYHIMFAIYMILIIKKENEKLHFGTNDSREYYQLRSSMIWNWNTTQYTPGKTFLSIKSQMTNDDGVDPKRILWEYFQEWNKKTPKQDVWHVFNHGDNLMDIDEFDDLLYESICLLSERKIDRYLIQPDIERMRKEICPNIAIDNVINKEEFEESDLMQVKTYSEKWKTDDGKLIDDRADGELIYDSVESGRCYKCLRILWCGCCEPYHRITSKYIQSARWEGCTKVLDSMAMEGLWNVKRKQTPCCALASCCCYCCINDIADIDLIAGREIWSLRRIAHSTQVYDSCRKVLGDTQNK